MPKIKVTFFMSGGNKVVIKCEKFNMTKLTSTKGSRKLDIIGATTTWAIDIDEVIAVTAKECLF